MLHHAARRADLTWTPLSSILQAAASRAWVRTRPVRSYHHSIPVRQDTAVSAADFKGGESSKSRNSRWDSQLRGSVTNPRQEGKDAECSAGQGHMPPLIPVPRDFEDFLEPIEDIETYTRPSNGVLYAPSTYSHPGDSDAPSRTPSTADRTTRVPTLQSLLTGCHDSCDLTDAGRFDGYEDDPPWDEVVESMREAGDPLPCVSSPATPTLPIELRRPTSPTELHHSLVYLSKPSHTGNTRPLQYLQRFHEEYPELQSTHSYNFLISLVIGSGELDTATRLLYEMTRQGLDGDLETRVLKVRMMIRQGRWGEAWQGQAASGQIPLQVWLEFFGTIKHPGKRVMDDDTLQEYLSKRGPVRSKHPGITLVTAHGVPSSDPSLQDSVGPASSIQPPLDQAAPGMGDGEWDADELYFGRQRAEGDPWRTPEPPSAPTLSTEVGRYEHLMRNFPPLTAKETACMPPRVIQTLVEWFVRTGKREAAFDATKAYIEDLPAKLDPRQREACLKMIHPQLIPAKANLPGYFKARKALKKLLALHPDLRPNATTLVYLLNALRTTTQCGELGFALAAQFRRRYGEHLLDERVRWRLAWLTLKQRQLHLAISVLSEHERVVKRQRARRREEGLAREFAAQRPPEGLPARPRFHEVFAARGLEAYWAPLRTRLYRIMAQRPAS